MTEEQKNEATTEETTIKWQQELEEYKDKYLRQLAETENIRKRLMKEKQDMVRFGVENIIAEVLAPIDNFENALKCAENSNPEIKNWAVGFEMILSQFKDVLSTHGVRAFHSLGEKFDPFLHEAVEVKETEEESLDGTIVEEFIKGYRCGDRTIRPARVKVGKKSQLRQQDELKGEKTI